MECEADVEGGDRLQWMLLERAGFVGDFQALPRERRDVEIVGTRFVSQLLQLTRKNALDLFGIAFVVKRPRLVGRPDHDELPDALVRRHWGPPPNRCDSRLRFMAGDARRRSN